MSTKICTKCSVEKPLSEFHKKYNTPDGHHQRCKVCVNELDRTNYKPKKKPKHPLVNPNNKICTKCFIEKPLSEYKKNTAKGKYYNPYCISCLKEYQDSHYKKYKKIKQINSRKNYHANKNRWKKYQQEYRTRYPEVGKWRDLLTMTLKATGKKKNTKTEKLLGYNSKQLKEHLDKQGMNWDKHTIDHKIPLSWFKPSVPCNLINSLINLQPLTTEGNSSKSNRFCSPVPSSYIEEVKPYIKKQYLPMLKISRL